MTRDEPATRNALRAFREQLHLYQWEVAERLGALATEHGYGEIGLDAHAVSRHERSVHRPSRLYQALYQLLYGVEAAVLWPDATAATPAVPAPAVPAPAVPVASAPWVNSGTVEASVPFPGRGDPVERRAFLLLAGSALTAPAHQWLIQEPDRLAAALGGDRVTPALAGRLPGMIGELRRMDDAHDPAVVLSLAQREYGWVAGLVDHGSYDESTGRQLHLALAEIGQVVGYMAYDRGDHVTAQRAYLAALRSAHSAGDRLLGSHVLKCMAEQAVELGRHRDALVLIDSALAGTRGSTAPGQRALLYSWKARAHAGLADLRPCRAAIDTARAHIDRDRGTDPVWLYWLSPADITTKAGEALLEARLYGPAERLLGDGLAALPADRHLGDQQLFLAQLSTAQVRTGAVDAALHSGHRALDLAGRRPSPRATRHLRELSGQLATRADNAPVREFVARARLVTAA